jgi:hypothetical protein
MNNIDTCRYISFFDLEFIDPKANEPAKYLLGYDTRADSVRIRVCSKVFLCLIFKFGEVWNLVE